MKYIAVFVGVFFFGVIVYLFSFSGDGKLEVVEEGDVSISFSQNSETIASEEGVACFESEECNVSEVMTQNRSLQKQTEGMEAVTVQEGVPITVETTGPEPSGVQANILEVDEYTGSSMEAETVQDGSFELNGEGEKYVEITAVWRKEEQQNKAGAVISRVMKVNVVE
ncbi:hypothetical protein [Salimicrobium halophilum]|uniref:Uncharacterized protein n=1 Tax=Salimicrobium halophilum TaxID=86666 RepID=A0A1G8RA51_9BACI|nr:hypothetical protein [Salimicrobium halophilum]SDJ13934.1 hypothetical protein SAMN04490247_0921 [Salimicrobium halophilum]